MIRRLGFRAPFGAVVFLGAGLCGLTQAVSGCGQTVEVGLDDALVTGATSGAGGVLQIAGAPPGTDGGMPTGQAGAPPCVEVACRGKPWQCGNCLDDDADGVIDSLDPDCLGPCDDDEVGLSSGMIVMQSATCRLDCYFDADSGAGNDQCDWSHKCDERSVAPSYPPSGEARCEYEPGAGMGLDCEALVEQPQSCRDACLPLVPNGCDCFGCCQLEDGEFHFIGRGRGELGCQRDALGDADACPPCTPVQSCLNRCEQCEVCVGRELDPECSGGNVCPPGQAACTTDAPCDFQEYCVTGCCVRAPEPI